MLIPRVPPEVLFVLVLYFHHHFPVVSGAFNMSWKEIKLNDGRYCHVF